MRRLLPSLMCLVVAAAAAAEDVRTWTDSQGRKMQAQFVREVDGDVTFLKKGKLVTLPLDKLSEDDQKFIRDAEANKKVEETAPPAGAPRPVDNSPLPFDAQASTDSKASLTKKKVAAEERTWRDVRGKAQVGKFVRMHQGVVVISSGARAIRMPFNSLSRPDREYLRELLAARGESAQLPPETSVEQQAEVAANEQPAESQPPETSEPERSGPPVASGKRAPVPNSGADSAGSRIASRTSPRPEPGRVSDLARAANNLPAGPQHENHARELRGRIGGATSLEPQTAPDARKPAERLSLTEPKQIFGFIVGLPIVAAIVSLLTAVVLRAAAYMVSGDHLPYGDAYGTMFLSYIANGAIGFVFALILQNMTEPTESPNPLSFLMLPIAFFVQTGIISTRHDTDVGPACLISLAVWLIWFAILFVVVLGVYVAFGVLPGQA